MKMIADVQQAKRARSFVDNREQIDAERFLELRCACKDSSEWRWHPRLANVDHDPHPFAIAFVAHVADAVDFLVAHKLGDALDQARLVHLIRDLGDNDGLLVSLARLDRERRA